jgi:hypothetical protein
LIYAQSSVAEWCARCVHPLDGSVDPLEVLAMMRMNVDAMGTFDWATLWFASATIALKLAGELKDIHMCELAIARAGDQLSVGWRIALRLLGGVRRWCFVAGVPGLVGWVVLLHGGDALSICCESSTHALTLHAVAHHSHLFFTHMMHAVNTVAVLFLTEIDNMAYALGLSEQARKQVEVKGRVELGEEATALLLRSKIAHMVAIVVGIGWVVVSRHTRGAIIFHIFFWLAGLVASIRPSPRETAKRMTTATVACVVGFLLLAVLGQYALGGFD